MGYQDSWAVEAPPLERQSVESDSEGGEEAHIIEYEMDAEYGLEQKEAYRLADAYMRGDGVLSEDAWWVGSNQEELGGQQTLDDLVAQ
jgi:hypothetical protein